MSNTLTLGQAREIAIKYFNRRDRFEEDKLTSLIVVLLNYGDHLTEVYCTNGEWEGTKGDLPPREGIPLCPNNHPLFERPTQFRLGLVETGSND